MDNLISRQMLLEYIHGEPVGRLLCDKYNLDGLIKQFPSAQPEVIRCKDCKYGSPNGQYGCKCYHYQLYETHEMYEHDFCSRAERRTE